MRASLDLLADLLADAVAEAECVVPEVIVTGGRPPSPSSEGRQCQTVIYVYGDNTADLNQNVPDACAVRGRWTMQYEIWTCYPEDWYDQIASTEADAAADCLYELMALSWCALVEAYDTGVPFGNCESVELQPLQVQPRSGGAVSAVGGLTVPYDCSVPETSPTSP